MQPQYLFEIYQSLKEKPSGSIEIAGLQLQHRLWLCSKLMTGELGSVCFIAKQEKDLHKFYELLSSWVSEDHLMVLPEGIGWDLEKILASKNRFLQRHQTLAALEKEKPHFVLTTLRALAQQTMPPSDLKKHSLEMAVGATLEQDQLEKKLKELGYEHVYHITDSEQYSIRGAIVDIYANQGKGFRLEYRGDQIHSIRLFDLKSKESVDSLQSITILPTREWVCSTEDLEQKAQVFYDYLKQGEFQLNELDNAIHCFLRGYAFHKEELFSHLFRQDSCLTFDYFQGFHFYFLSPPDETVEVYQKGLEADQNMYAEHLRQKNITVQPEEIYASVPQVEELFATRKSAHLVIAEKQHNSPDTLTLKDTPPPTLDWKKITPDQLPFATVISCKTEGTKDRIKRLFNYREIQFSEKESVLDLPKSPRQSQVYLIPGRLPKALTVVPDQEYWIPAETFISGQGQEKEQDRPEVNFANFMRQLTAGDLVVHMEHGIGRYLGIQNLSISGSPQDYILIEYGGGDKIYVPTDRLHLIQKYQIEQGKGGPRLDRLKSAAWKQRKSRARKAIRDMADELLKLYAKRQLARGIRFEQFEEEIEKFADQFPFEETEDQLKAIQDILSDMDTDKAMDRLVCGDVGFGKTEVALRGIYRVCLNRYQTLVLVPTTILSFQHHQSFQKRLGPFGVNVACINRFVSAAEQKQILHRFELGEIDVLIGTHRLLSKDIKPHRLGFIVVDEEQKFGVVHKERIKNLKVGAEILTLTATPIPRTLHLSLIGLKDISLLTTPPANRVPVKTYVQDFDEMLIAEALKAERKRGGQVFYLHNRVSDIGEITLLLRQLAPEMRIQFAHAQMKEDELEEIIVAFTEQKFDVLVCTTIIESGIDMPNVNTLIVDHADRFGLTQLYQLRGRVGRSAQQAYAYFLKPKGTGISEDAKDRLQVLLSHQELGSGFQIASHDLDLRGSGTVLGGEQSGKITDVGIDLYMQMLEEEIEKIRGGEVEEKLEIEMQIPFEITIPPSYIENEADRLQVYRQIFGTRSLSELDKMRKKTQDQYGAYPQQVELLFKIAELRKLLEKMRTSKCWISQDTRLSLKIENPKPEIAHALIEKIRNQPNKFALGGSNIVHILNQQKMGQGPEKQISFVDKILPKVEDLAEVFT